MKMINTGLRWPPNVGEVAASLLFRSRDAALTLWLFTRSDLKTILIPCAFFATICAIASNDVMDALLIARRSTCSILWIWINLLPFNIDNQRSFESIQEDRQNKPWRPLPAGRISFDNATGIMRFFYISAVILSFHLGGLRQCIGLLFLGSWYNGYKGADSNFLVRNLINSAGYICFMSGAIEVMLQTRIELYPQLLQWTFVIGAVIVTSIQAQDMPDQVGDRSRARQTLPLVLGDGPARWTIATAIAGWSWACPAFWFVTVGDFVLFPHSLTSLWMSWYLDLIPILPLCVGVIVAGRFLLYRSADKDKTSFLLYNFWILSLFLLPLISVPYLPAPGSQQHTTNIRSRA